MTAEEPLEIWLKHPLQNSANAKLLLTTMRTPGDDISLVNGWIYTSGIVGKYQDVNMVNHIGSQRLQGKQSNQVLISLLPQSTFDFSSTQATQHIEYVNSGCGVCGQQSIESLLNNLPQHEAKPNGATKASNATISAQYVFELAAALKEAQSAFQFTGGSHGAGLFSLATGAKAAPKLLDVREDIGRHNALDKLIGANLPLLSEHGQFAYESKHVIEYGVVLSSRISFDLVQKAAMANISFILAMGAPSSLAIELANECDICVIGFIQQQRINVYTCSHKVI